MNYDIAFAPSLSIWFLTALIGISFLPVLWGLIQRLRGSIIRAIAWAMLATAILNPSLLIEDREKLKSIVAIVTDNSGSQNLDGRAQQTNKIKAKLIEDLSRIEGFEIREINVADQISTNTDISTALFGALQSSLKDVSASQIAGAVLITDGRVHDIPNDLSSLNIQAPIHALITGEKQEKDRHIKIVEAPRYAVVGESYEITYEVTQQGFKKGEEVSVSIYIDGNLITTEPVIAGEPFSFIDDVRHGGKNIIEFRLEHHPDELTDANNRVFTTLNGIRENLRVLLVSGEPHIGERTWRNLLKSDASVDLVHFTILRPPEKQDGTPINELSLIAFPTHELFVQKIDEFDLIIFDRYSRRGVLPALYFDNIARYVREGGAILVAAGPEYGVTGSIAQTPLASVLPALPTGKMWRAPFKPIISELGQKHPVTRGLDKGNTTNPNWSHWFRNISVADPTGEVIMEGANNSPLLVLQRYNEGRVALLLSDHAWLWARGYEGGGPHVQLLRRVSHWLMKEPELEEERLTAFGNGTKITIHRQTLKQSVENVEETTIIAPSGKELKTKLVPTKNKNKTGNTGVYSGEIEVSEIGLYRINNDALTALTHIGPPNPKEFTNVISTTKLLAPIIEESGGKIQRVLKDASNLPRLLAVRNGASAKGNGWIGFKKTQATVLKGINRVSLFSGFLGLALLLFAFTAVWTREGR